MPRYEDLSVDDRIVASEILDFLRHNDHALIQQSVIRLELLSQRLQVESLSNFRDVLDHLHRAAQPGTTRHSQQVNLGEAYEHLRRAAVHALQDDVEKLFQVADRQLASHWVRIGLYLEVPKVSDVRSRLRAALKDLEQARKLKGDRTRTQEAIEHLEACREKLEDILVDMRPPWRVMLLRGVYTLGFILLGIFIKWMFE